MIKKTVKWFHLVTGYPIEKRSRTTCNTRYHHPHLYRYIDTYKCPEYQTNKLVGRGYGLLPERKLRSEPFLEVAGDLIGPWKIKVQGRAYECNTLIVIDRVPKLVELTIINHKTSE